MNINIIGNQNLIPQHIQTWLGALDEDGDKILVRRAYIDLCDGDPYATLIFSQLMYYYQPDKKGRSKLRVKKNGDWWIAKKYEDWEAECRVNRHTAKKAINLLKKTGLVITCSAMFNGLKMLHLRIDFECLGARMQTLNKAKNTAGKRSVRSDGRVGPTGPDRSDQLYPTGRTFGVGPITQSTPEKTSKDGEPLVPCYRKGDPDFLISGKTDGEPSMDPDAAKPQVADAPEETDDDNPEPGACGGLVMSKGDPQFPRRGAYPDWCAWVKLYDIENARKLDALFPRDTLLVENNDAARKYHARRSTGMLTPRGIDMLARFYLETFIDPDHETPQTLDRLLRKDVLVHVLDACRDAVRQAIVDINAVSNLTYEEQRTVQEFVSAPITPETDMVDEMMLRHSNVVGCLFAGHARGAPRVLEAAQSRREAIIDEVERTRAWNSFLGGRYNAELPEILGLSLSEIEELQRRYAEDKERRLQELRAYLC